MAHPSEGSLPDNRELKFASYLGMFNSGLLNSAVGPLLIELTGFYQLNVARVGLPVLLDGTGYLLGTIILSFVWKVHRARLVLCLSTLSLVFLLVSIGPFHSRFEVFLGLMFFLGSGFGFLTVGLDSLFSEIYRQNRAKYLNILHLFFGVGSFLGPLAVVAILKATGKWFYFYPLIGLLNIPMLPLLLRRKNYPFGLDLEGGETDGRHEGIRNLMGSAAFWAIIAAMFLHLGMEASFGAWMPLFLKSTRNMTPTLASYCVSIFWLAFLLGRASYARLFPDVNLFLSLIVAISGAALFMCLTFLSRDAALIFSSTFCAGLLLSIVYPNFLALGAGIFPNRIGFITGTLSASGGVGYMFFPWLIGPVSQSLGLAKGVFMIPLLGTASIGILLLLRSHKKGGATTTPPS
ncbi:MAG: MFS transporter [Deltaproteobacteria bacterium]|nr:MFS transporter [Deltaproteobacteria bacterium]